MINEQPIPAPATTEEFRRFARVVVAALGVLLAYWKLQGQPDQHPYRQAATMIRSYLQRNYRV